MALNKRLILTSFGLVVITGAAGAGISELFSTLALQSSIENKQYVDLEDSSSGSLNREFIVPLGLKNDAWNNYGNKDTKSSDQSSSDEETRLVSGQDPSSTAVAKLASSTTTNNNNNADIDEGYLNSLGSTSMGGKFKDDVILAPKGSSVGQQKADQLKKKAQEGNGRKNGLFVIKNKLYNAWDRERIDLSDINGEKVHSICTSILSHSDYGIGFTHISRLNQKGFFDFVWESCGKEGKSKPSNGKFA